MDKTTLRQYRVLLREIDELEREKRRVLDRYLAPPQPTGLPGTSGIRDRLGEVVARRERFQDMIDAKLDELLALREEIEAAIAGLSAEDRLLIRLRYIEGRSWVSVARELHYSLRHTQRRHGLVLRKLE